MGQESIEELTEKLVEISKKLNLSFEILLVDDGSKDRSWKKIQSLSDKHKMVKGVRLSRNFGQHYAISAGLEFCTGEHVIVMDCDLQDLPEEVPRLMEEANKGFDVVLARRRQRNDSSMRKILSRMFYQFLSYISGINHDSGVANFGVYSKRVVQAVNAMGDDSRYFPAMVKWVGFESSTIDVTQGKRNSGKSNYDFKRLTKLALDIILSFSDKPLVFAAKAGATISAISFSFAIYIFFRAINGQISALGYPSLMVSIWFLAGLILLTISIVGLYVGKTFENSKQRPRFIVMETTRQ
jgi:dolichol-phosphate mannosyltransferase